MRLVTTPYWWEEMQAPDIADAELPERVDVLIVGSGYTGLNAALQISRGGHSTLVVDAEQAGWGCSTRNGGQISTSIKPTLPDLSRRFGQKRAIAILQEGYNSLAWIEQFVEREALDCNFEVCGRFHAAHNKRALQRLRKTLADPFPGLSLDAELVEPEQQHQFLGSNSYHGGIFFRRYASLHPARYHAALVNRVIQAGAQIVSDCEVMTINAEKNCYKVATQQGDVLAKKVVVATNGYSGKLLPWLQRRIIPIGSYLIATDEIPLALMQQLMPKRCMVTDTRKVVYYYRHSTDRKRIIFGGRVSSGETSDQKSASLLKRDLDALFPQLRDFSVTHAWHGFVAYTFDELPHVGRKDGIYYAMGYCGSGVGMASYLGMRLGLQVLEKEQGQTAFDTNEFPTRLFYTGNPWFLSPSVYYYRMRDKLNI